MKYAVWLLATVLLWQIGYGLIAFAYVAALIEEWEKHG